MKEVIVWFGCGMICSLVPVGFCGYRAYANGSRPWLLAACGRGELFLLGAANCAAGLANLFMSDTTWGIVKASLGLFMMILLFVTGLVYADFTAPGRRPRFLETPVIVRVSIRLYCLSAVIALICIFCKNVTR